MRPLWPALASIQQRIFRQTTQDLPAEELAFIGDEEDTALPIPAAINDHIERTTASQSHGKRPPNPGDIVLAVTEAAPAVAFCLDAPGAKNDAGTRWSGWMAAPEVDYASDRDVLIEPGDGPADPLAGMVQTWNPLTLLVPQTAIILATLSTYRLNLLRELARESASNHSELAKPGHIALRPTVSRRIVLTGSPLGTEDDPRREYQELYASLAKALAPASMVERQHTAVALSNETLAYRLLNWIQGHRLASGAALAASVLCGVVIFKFILLADPTLVQGTQMAQVGPAKVTPPTPESAEPKTAKVPEKPKPVTEETKPRKPPRDTHIAQKQDDDFSLAGNYLVPIKDQSIVLAMRSGPNDDPDVMPYRIYLKKISNVDQAIELLGVLGFRVIQIEAKTKSIQVMIEKSKVSSELENKLTASDLFIQTPVGN